MAQFTTMARPYARAAFESAASNGTLEQWSSMLGLLAALQQHGKVAAYLATPALGGEGQAKALLDLCGDALNEQGSNFVRMLAANKRLPLLPEIVTLFEALKAESEKTIDVEVSSAFALGAEAQDKLAAALKQRLQRNVKLNTQVDAALIGGVVIRAGDLVIDGSVRGKLNKLVESINI